MVKFVWVKFAIYLLFSITTLNMNIAIVGATGNVGRKTLEVFDKKNFKFDNLYLVASEKSAGKKIFLEIKNMLLKI